MSYQPSSHSPMIATLLRRFRRLSPQWLIGLGLLGLLLVAVPVVKSLSSARPETESAQADSLLPVETITPSQSNYYEVTRAYTGEVSTVQASELGFERSGQLTEILVSEGAQVQAGAPLARLDVQNLQTQRLQIEAEKARAIAQLRELEAGARAEDIAAAEAAVRDLEQQIALQRTQLVRREVLYERGAISRETLDEFSFGEGALQARLDQARSQLRELQNGTRPEQISAQEAVVRQLDARLADLDVTLAKSTLNAPFSGRVSEHRVDAGTVVSAGQPVLRLVESAMAEARVGIPATAVSKLRVGEEKTVEVNGEQYTATVASILPEVDAQTRTQTVVLTLGESASAQVNPGQTVRLNLTERIASEGVWLPTEALTQGIRGLWTGYVVVSEESSSDGEKERTYVVQPKSVEIVHQENNRVFVNGTIEAGDDVVASGAHRLVPGQQVTLVDKPTQSFVAD